jgi:hypothetical protein
LSRNLVATLIFRAKQQLRRKLQRRNTVECLTEFTCSVYVDGELPADELQQAEEHLVGCPDCRKLVAALREETRNWVACIQEIDMVSPVIAAAPLKTQKSASRADIVKFGGILVGLTSLLRLAMSSPEKFELPSSPVNLDWLDASELYSRLSWLGGAIYFLPNRELTDC